MKRKLNPLEIQQVEKRVSSFKISRKSGLIELIIGILWIALYCDYGIIPFTYGRGEEEAFLDAVTIISWAIPLFLICSGLETMLFPSRQKKIVESVKQLFTDELKKR